MLMKTLPQDSLVSSSQLRLMDAIGQGIQNIASNMFAYTCTTSLPTGEFGVVYRARLVKGPMPQQVAVKTLKGSYIQSYAKGSNQSSC